jgi:cytochrome c5
MTQLFRGSMGFVLLAYSAAGLLAQAATPVKTGTSQAKPAQARKVVDPNDNPPERAFQAHCSRCHYAPETLSPRITGTVVRHMRVRANLSAEDERLILSYLNP